MRCAELAEDQHVVQKGVDAHGDGEEDHAEAGILRGALHPGVDAADAVEDVGEAHNADVAGAQGHQVLVGGHETQDFRREEEGDEGHRQGEEGHGVEGDAHAAVDAVCVPPAPVLAHQNGEAALEAEDHQLQDEDRDVGGGDGGHLGVAQKAHHEGVREAQGGGDKVLQHDGQRQHPKSAVEAGFPAEKRCHGDGSFSQNMGKRVS